MKSSNAWQYAIFDPDHGEVVTPRNALAFEPSTNEKTKCFDLGVWWRNMNLKEQKSTYGAIIHQISAPPPKVTKRQHRLFKDASPEVEPQGFFDCTFEVRAHLLVSLSS